MTITNTWLVEQMECYPTKDNFTDVVFTVHWRANSTDGTYNATAYGSVGVTLDPTETFIPYANLTQDEVIGWVKKALGADQVAQIETGLAGQIANLQNPPVVTLPNPWTV